MGASNVVAAFTLYAGRIPATAMQVLAYMAVVSKDDDARPWFGQGHAALAEHALGRTAPVQRADVKAVERAVQPLLAIGAITTDRRASLRRDGAHTVRYRLNLSAVIPRKTGDVPIPGIDQNRADRPSQGPQRPPETGPHVPRNSGSRPPETVPTSPENRGREEPGGTRRSEKTEEEAFDLSADLTPTREHDSDQEPENSSLPDRCEHGLTSRHRTDGRPSCALCRRTAPDSSPLADVIPIRSAS